MEKLMELLNEYENRDDDQQIEWRIGEGDKGENGKVRGVVNEVYMGWVSELVVCSAYYGFIKWLVDNDKIDKKKIDTRLVKSVESHYDEEGYWVENSYEDYSDYECLLMLLSISSSPIDDLILYLK